MNRIITLNALVLLFAIVACGQGRFDDVTININKLTDQIYMLEGSGGNIGLYIGADETFLIDDQFAPLSSKIQAAIATLTDKPVSRLVNTHWHGDHTGGNENFGKGGAMIMAHDNVYKRMSTEQVRGERTTPAAPAVALPVITFSESMTIRDLREQIMIQHVHNGHTDGDAFVLFVKSNVLHMGDIFFNGRFPYIDLDSGGSLKGMLSAVGAALMLVDDETQIIPGHGPMATKKDLMIYHQFLSTLTERLEDAIANGRALEDIKVELIVAGFEDLKWNFINAEKIVTIGYNSLKNPIK